MVATITMGLAACGASVGTSATTTTSAAAMPMSAVTENQLRADWRAQPLGDRTRLTGSVYNGWVMWARDIILLVDSLDATGQVVRQTQTRLWRPIGPGSSSYFDVTLPTAASHRVQIVGVRWLTDDELRY